MGPVRGMATIPAEARETVLDMYMAAPNITPAIQKEKKIDFDFKISSRDSKWTADKTELSERTH